MPPRRTGMHNEYGYCVKMRDILRQTMCCLKNYEKITDQVSAGMINARKDEGYYLLFPGKAGIWVTNNNYEDKSLCLILSNYLP